MCLVLECFTVSFRNVSVFSTKFVCTDRNVRRVHNLFF